MYAACKSKKLAYPLLRRFRLSVVRARTWAAFPPPSAVPKPAFQIGPVDDAEELGQ